MQRAIYGAIAEVGNLMAPRLHATCRPGLNSDEVFTTMYLCKFVKHSSPSTWSWADPCHLRPQTTQVDMPTALIDYSMLQQYYCSDSITANPEKPAPLGGLYIKSSIGKISQSSMQQH